MKFWYTDKKKKKLKSDLLREVFEENLNIKEEKVRNHPQRQKKKKILLISSIFFLVMTGFIFFNYFVLRHQPELQAIAPVFLKPGKTNQPPNTELYESGRSSFTPPQYAAFLEDLQTPLRKIFGLKVKRILIDPGHGGIQNGTMGKLGLKEKDITLDIAMRLKDRLIRHGKYHILMTREEDITLSLEDRIAFANFSRVDLFISIHLNYFPNKPVNIIETFYFGPHTDNETLLLAEKENTGTEYTLNDFKEIIGNIKNTLKTQESHSVAFFIQKSLYRNIKQQNNHSRNLGIKTAPFLVLLGVEVPSVLTEVTCLSNIAEEEKLTKSDYREKIAAYLEEGIIDYLNKNSGYGQTEDEKEVVK